MTEQELVVAARSGNKDAFAQLLGNYQGPIYNLCYRMLGQFCEAEDATQETFLRAFSQIHRYDPGRPLKTWLFAIASHYCIDRLRRRRVTWLGIHEESLLTHPALIEPRPLPDDEAIQHELNVAIQTFLSRLQPQDRNAIIMRYWHCMSYHEIAEVTGASVSAVKSRLHRARTTMGEMMMASDKHSVLSCKTQQHPSPLRNDSQRRPPAGVREPGLAAYREPSASRAMA